MPTSSSTVRLTNMTDFELRARNAMAKWAARNAELQKRREVAINKWHEAIEQFELIKREHDQARKAEQTERMAFMKSEMGQNGGKVPPDLLRMLRSNRVTLQSGIRAERIQCSKSSMH